jgi:soluble lytic murein transglycosylase
MEFIRKHKWWLFALIALGGLLTLWERWRTWKENSQDGPILAAARKYDVDPALVKAVVWRESWFNPHARGSRGEVGLMQIRKPAAQEWAEAEGVRLFNHTQLFDPVKNTLAGTWYLRRLLRRYAQTDDPVSYALADYNAGRANVLRWLKGTAATNSTVFVRQIDFPSTKNYVLTVQKRYLRYRGTFPSKDRRSASSRNRDNANALVSRRNRFLSQAAPCLTLECPAPRLDTASSPAISDLTALPGSWCWLSARQDAVITSRIPCLCHGPWTRATWRWNGSRISETWAATRPAMAAPSNGDCFIAPGL